MGGCPFARIEPRVVGDRRVSSTILSMTSECGVLVAHFVRDEGHVSSILTTPTTTGRGLKVGRLSGGQEIRRVRFPPP